MPWQQLAKRSCAELAYIPFALTMHISTSLSLPTSEGGRPKVACSVMSNVLDAPSGQ